MLVRLMVHRSYFSYDCILTGFEVDQNICTVGKGLELELLEEPLVLSGLVSFLQKHPGAVPVSHIRYGH